LMFQQILKEKAILWRKYPTWSRIRILQQDV
jgi:hypothetical protein